MSDTSPPEPSRAEGEGSTAATNRTAWSGTGIDPVEDVRYRMAAMIGTLAQSPTWVTTPGLAPLLSAVVLEDAPGQGRTPDYDKRNHYLLMAIGAAAVAGVPVGVLIDPAEPDWPCVMFELPTGQVGWHLPRHEVAYDGHTTPDKNRRVNAWLAQLEEADRA